MFLSKQFLSLFLVLLLALHGCSSRGKPQMTDFFHTEIREDGSKMFTFTVVVTQNRSKVNKQESQPHNQASRERGSGGKKGSGNKRGDKTNKVADNGRRDDSVQMAELFEELFQKRMEKTRYCRESYIELEKGFSGAIFKLRGECRESATDEDRKHFL